MHVSNTAFQCLHQGLFAEFELLNGLSELGQLLLGPHSQESIGLVITGAQIEDIKSGQPRLLSLCHKYNCLRTLIWLEISFDCVVDRFAHLQDPLMPCIVIECLNVDLKRPNRRTRSSDTRMEVEGTVGEANSEPVRDILCVGQWRGQAYNPHILLDGFIILGILLIAQHLALNAPDSAHHDLVNGSRTSMALVKQMNIVKNVEAHLLNLLSLPPLP